MDKNEKMNKEIHEAIEANLSSQVGKVLRERLTWADEAENKIESLQQQNEKLVKDAKLAQETIQKQSSELQGFNLLVAKLESREIELEKKELELMRREVKFEVEQVKTKAAQLNLTQIMEMFRVVFKNPVAQREIITNENMNSYYNSQKGCNENMPSGYKTKTIKDKPNEEA